MQQNIPTVNKKNSRKKLSIFTPIFCNEMLWFTIMFSVSVNNLSFVLLNPHWQLRK